MSRMPAHRRPGDFELRVLADGRLVLIGPDQDLLEIGTRLCRPDEPVRPASAETSLFPGQEPHERTDPKVQDTQ